MLTAAQPKATGTCKNLPRARMAAGASRTAVAITRNYRLRLAVAVLLCALSKATMPIMASTTDMDVKCPLQYQRHTMQQLEAGTEPYLFGGKQLNYCKRSCSSWDVKSLVASYVERNWTQLVKLTPCDLWPYIHNRTLWIMGDSQSLDFYKALRCFFVDFWTAPGDNLLPTDDPGVLEALSRVLTPICMQLPGHTRICYVRVDKGNDFVSDILPLYSSFGSPHDVLVVNFGLHHGSGEQYKDILQDFVEYVRANQRLLPTILWQQTSAQHYMGWQGEYPGGSPPFKCVPRAGATLLDDGTLHVEKGEDEGLAHGAWRNKIASEVLAEIGMTILPSYNETVPLHRFHRDNGHGHECTHFCFPSAPQTWVFALYRGLVQHHTGELLDPTVPFPDDDEISFMCP